MKTLLLPLFAAFFVFQTEAASADELVAAGRGSLAAGRLTEAEASFAQAVQLAPENQTARLFHAITLVFNTPADPRVATALTQLEIRRRNYDTYFWEFEFPEVNGELTFTNEHSIQLLADALNNAVVPRLLQAATNLSRIQPGFSAVLSAEEAKTDLITVDYADAQLARAGILAAASVFQWLSASDFNLKTKVLAEILRSDNSSVESVLATYPALLTVRTAERGQAGRAYLAEALSVYQTASDALRARVNVERFFTLESDDLADEAKFRDTLQDIQRSLIRPAVLRHDTNIVVRAGALYTGQLGLRDFLPDFSENALIATTMSLNGLVVGDLGLLENELGEMLDLEVAPMLGFRIEGTGPSLTIAGASLPHVVEQSADLKTWQPAFVTPGPIVSPVATFLIDGRATVTLPPADQRARFYRVRVIEQANQAQPPMATPPASFNGRTIILWRSTGGSRTLQFAGDGPWFTLSPTFAGYDLNTGSFSTHRPDPGPANQIFVNLTPMNPQPNSSAHIELRFSTQSSGSYQARPAGGGVPPAFESGTFDLH